ncbi:MAG: carotenoid oxygenase family protein [Solirubrobacterales bacterium]|nr:carotenoid oxygenase family protein [Solirubrobacterales bacterium]
MEVNRRRLLRDGLGAGAALTLGAAVRSLPVPEATAAKPRAPHALGFRSLTDEVRLPDVPVDGRVPRWLSGVLLRNGPGLFEIGETKLNHWFDGLAMLHAFAFADGRVSYANRFLQSSAYKAYRREGIMKYSEFGTDPCRAIFSGVSTLPLMGKIPNANVSIEHLAGEFRAHTELPVPVSFDPRSLKTLGVDVPLPNGRMGTAHPHYDPRTRERFSYELELIPPSGLRVIAEKRGNRRELAFIPQDRPGYLHSFGLTRRWVVVFAQPWEFDLATFLGPDSGPIVKSFQWDDSKPSRIMLIDRRAGGVGAEFEVDPAFAFHHINAFDDGDSVVFDVCAHRDASVVDALYLKNLRKPGPKVPQASPRRMTVKPGSSRVRVRELAEGNLELPRTDYASVNGRPYRYAYGVGVRNPRRSGFVDRIAKLDVKRGEQTHWQERGTYPGEPIFVRRPHAKREDDGLLLSVVLDAGRRTSFLLVLDARDMSEIARASVPHHIPFGFHGVHAADA